MKIVNFICAPFFYFLMTGIVFAEDIIGSKDHASMKRYEGSEIIGYLTLANAPYEISLGNSIMDGHFEKKINLEGNITRFVYRISGNHTSYEIFRNYEQAFLETNFEVLYTSDMTIKDPNFLYTLCSETHDSTACPIGDTDTNKRYMSAKKISADNKYVYASVLVGEVTNDKKWNIPWHPTIDYAAPVDEKRGDVIVILDVIETHALKDDEGVLSASIMLDTINSTGKIDVYGIKFMSDKAEIKQESTPTLLEIVDLLQKNPPLKLNIAVHTDNHGDPLHNLNLSSDRANSIVSLLKEQYLIDGTRLQSTGYGDAQPIADNETEEGRQKNNRIELSRFP